MQAVLSLPLRIKLIVIYAKMAIILNSILETSANGVNFSSKYYKTTIILNETYIFKINLKIKNIDQVSELRQGAQKAGDATLPRGMATLIFRPR